MLRTTTAALVLAGFCCATPVAAQSVLTATNGKSTHHAGGPSLRSRNVRVAADVLKRSPRISLDLFDDVRVTAKRTKMFSPRPHSVVWTGTLDGVDKGHVTLSIVNGVVSGTVFAFGRTFEILPWTDGTAEVRELDPAKFPTDDPDLDAVSLDVASGLASTGSAVVAADGVNEIDVMVVWTPNARTAVGGTAAQIQSLVDTAVANANAAYANSGVPAHLRVVYSGEVAFTEATGSISGDLSKLTTNGDGVLDAVHSLRTQYGADVVTLIGKGYASGSGACGVGYLMTTVSTSFAPYAFNDVDQSCAAGYLSYAHEVGHNEGVQHDPANAGGAPSYPYAYGYQDPSGAFRTVMAYGSATRVPYFSSPNVLYNGRPTGLANAQDNARALTNTVATVAAFKAGTTSQTPTCTYSVTPASLSYPSTGSTLAVNVATQSGCSWSVDNTLAWVTPGTGSGTGSGTVTLTAAANSAGARSGRVTVAGVSVSVSQASATPTCSYSVTPTSLSFASTGGTLSVSVSAPTGCAWTAQSGLGWVTLGSASGSGSASVAVIVPNYTGTTARSGSITVAGKTVSVSQKTPKVVGKGRK
jgi:hypothetical protein